MRDLRTAVYVVLVAWGIRTASSILSVVLISLLVAYAFLPLPRWLMHRFGVRKGSAVGLTLALLATIHLVAWSGLVGAGIRFHQRLPVYEQHFRSLYGQLALYLSAHGMDAALISFQNLSSSTEIVAFLRSNLPTAMSLLSDRLLVPLLSFLFVWEMADPHGAEAGALARHLAHYGSDVQTFISVTAKTAAINALANLVILVVLGVDFPILWCFLYFFLDFVPSLGFLIALIPPTFVALLMLGWKRALLVAGGLILTQMIVDYAITPRLMKKTLEISFLEIMLSVTLWGFLLGLPGVVLAIPLTMALKKYLRNRLQKEEPSLAKAPG
jgi:predicted PurR-regulated permease PerM